MHYGDLELEQLSIFVVYKKVQAISKTNKIKTCSSPQFCLNENHKLVEG